MFNKKLLAASAAATIFAGAANAAVIDITFTNNSGFLATPVYTGFHDGSFDAFDEGSAASAGIELVAELPIPPFSNGGVDNALRDERVAAQADSQGGFIFGPGGPIADGEVGTARVDVTDSATNRYLSLFAMFVPSNDTFIGNDDPFAYEIFDAAGNVIEQIIEITAESIWDAGTEINQLIGAAAPGQDITLGDDEGGLIANLLDIVGSGGGDNDGFDDLASLFGVAGAGDITANTVLFTVEVAAVPLPAGLPLMLAGLGAFGIAKRRKKA